MSNNDHLIELSSMFRTFLKGVSQEWNKHGYSMNQTQFRVLYMLHKHGPQNVSQLACCLTLTSAAITGATDYLLSGGYVEKTRDEDDRRVVTISLSDKGEKLVKEFLENQREVIEAHFKVLSEEDIQHLKRIFGILNAELEKI
ncbi:MarR family winged helix-turn-helix transcriptional regulator [Gorillibacterium timonense]|uniref:MarR family winged helix-turn-helix transcriptional regulator n=1 Tax=Gorillibacterium timonense TaxID=1689269 RepID=UPI001F1FACD9|nr:MarR family transcriptional regulator [Gorillibacterium timonense]